MDVPLGWLAVPRVGGVGRFVVVVLVVWGVASVPAALALGRILADAERSVADEAAAYLRRRDPDRSAKRDRRPSVALALAAMLAAAAPAAALGALARHDGVTTPVRARASFDDDVRRAPAAPPRSSGSVVVQGPSLVQGTDPGPVADLSRRALPAAELGSPPVNLPALVQPALDAACDLLDRLHLRGTGPCVGDGTDGRRTTALPGPG